MDVDMEMTGQALQTVAAAGAVVGGGAVLSALSAASPPVAVSGAAPPGKIWRTWPFFGLLFTMQ